MCFHFQPDNCGCGDAIAIKVDKVVDLLQNRYKGIHKNTIENHLKQVFPCMRTKARFLTEGTEKQQRAVHFSKTYLKDDVVEAMTKGRYRSRHLKFRISIR